MSYLGSLAKMKRPEEIKQKRVKKFCLKILLAGIQGENVVWRWLAPEDPHHFPFLWDPTFPRSFHAQSKFLMDGLELVVTIPPALILRKE